MDRTWCRGRASLAALLGLVAVCAPGCLAGVGADEEPADVEDESAISGSGEAVVEEAAEEELANWGPVEPDLGEDELSADQDLGRLARDGRAVIRFRNRCGHPVIIGHASSEQHFLTLKPGHRADRFVGRDSRELPGLAFFAARKGRNPGAGHRTLAEFTLNTTNDWLHRGDSVDVSLVDGFTLPMSIRPVGQHDCPKAQCLVNLLPNCPRGNRINRNGHTISCSKKGDVDNQFNPAAVYFERHCKHAYSWSEDDRATKGCHAQDYIVTICG
jgi:hypothetical protein